MTREEIVRALRCCGNNRLDCQGCPLERVNSGTDACERMFLQAADLLEKKESVAQVKDEDQVTIRDLLEFCRMRDITISLYFGNNPYFDNKQNSYCIEMRRGENAVTDYILAGTGFGSNFDSALKACLSPMADIVDSMNG